ncbi:hypothetical protein ABPG74_019587 [Tetrahymena malaccensis]
MGSYLIEFTKLRILSQNFYVYNQLTRFSNEGARGLVLILIEFQILEEGFQLKFQLIVSVITNILKAQNQLVTGAVVFLEFWELDEIGWNSQILREIKMIIYQITVFTTLVDDGSGVYL